MVDLLVVLPTLNERDNVNPIAERIKTALAGISYRIVFVDDDSTDGTLDVLAELAERDPSVTYLRRIGRSGLASAVVEGALVGRSRYIAVMDSDLQHDEALLPKMLGILSEGETDIVIASRFAPGADIGDFAELRLKTSQVGIRMAGTILKVKVHDPLTGYFMMRREFFESVAPRLEPMGFKILLEVLHKAGANVRVREVPFFFGTRVSGESKLDLRAGLEYLAQIYQSKFGRILPLPIAVALSGLAAAFLMVSGVAALARVLGSSLPLSIALGTLATAPAAFWFKKAQISRRKRPKGPALLGSLSIFLLLVAAICMPALLLPTSHVVACFAASLAILVASSVFRIRPTRPTPAKQVQPAQAEAANSITSVA